MLVLRRGEGESIIIGDEGNIIITIMQVDGGLVKVGIEAPRSIPVHRSELYHKIKRNESAKHSETGVASGSQDRQGEEPDPDQQV